MRVFDFRPSLLSLIQFKVDRDLEHFLAPESIGDGVDFRDVLSGGEDRAVHHRIARRFHDFGIEHGAVTLGFDPQGGD